MDPLSRPSRPFGLLTALLLAVALLSGCAALPRPTPHEPQHAIADTGTTPLQRTAAASLAGATDGESGFRLLPDGPEAFDTRLELARGAARSLDLQVYTIGADPSGFALLDALADAAARGVRVRLLVDDLYAAELDGEFARLAAAGASVRVFNPLPVRRAAWHTRLLLSLHDLARVNRRMHNKLMVADGTFAVAGGRNVGDAYFMRSEAANFADMDVLAAGPVVQRLSAVFDAYWNSEQAWPAERVARSEPSDRAHGTAVDAPECGVPTELAAGRVALRFGRAAVHADDPAKARPRDAAAAPGAAMQGALALFESAREEVQVISPYFVPGRRGVALMREAADRGVRIAVMTNSLAATDEPLTFYGYLRYREDMLRLGATLVETGPAPERRAERRASSAGRLHAKLALVDRRFVMIGSINMDPRSARTNTELALVIDSPALAAELEAVVGGAWAGAAQHRPGLGQGSAEPGVGALTRLHGGLLSVLVPEEML